MMTRTTRSTKDDIVLEKPSNDDDEEEEENKEGLLRLTFQIWRHQAETEKQTQLLHIVLEKKQMELLKFSLHRRALRYQRACFTRWREEVERTKIQNKRLKSKVEGLRLRYLRCPCTLWSFRNYWI